MPGKIAASLRARGAHWRAAGEELHHISQGPGPDLEAEWRAAGLTIPDLCAMRHYRFDRIIEQLESRGYDGCVLRDPMNIRYASDSTNMQLWVMHNPTRYVWVGADRSMIVWEFYNCDFLSGHNELIDEVRPSVASIYFCAGPRHEEMAHRWAAEMIDVVREHGGGESPRIAIDVLPGLTELHDLMDAGIRIENGNVMMEEARRIKGPDELLAMRCAVAGCEAAMADMRAAFRPGMTERELWAELHAGNIRRGGEWIETQILASGPRTNPWMQEASSRVIEEGDLVGYDTDLVGAYGMMCDISRTWIAGDRAPTAHQQHVYSLAREQIERNHELLQPGATLGDITHKLWFPDPSEYDHYCCSFHGVGQCDEYPDIFFPHMWERSGYDGVLEPGMVLTAEAFVGAKWGGEGVKLEQQYLVTESGPELLTTSTIDLC